MITGSNVNIGKGIFNSELAYYVPNTGPLSEHDHTFDNMMIFTGFQVDFVRITGLTDRQTYKSDHWE